MDASYRDYLLPSFTPISHPLPALNHTRNWKSSGYSAPTHATHAVQHRFGFVANVYSQAKKLIPQRISHVCAKQDQLPSHLTFAESVSWGYYIKYKGGVTTRVRSSHRFRPNSLLNMKVYKPAAKTTADF